MPAGRPLTLTPKVQAAICKAIRDGNYREVAAAAAGVPKRTFMRWCRKGRKAKSGEFWHLWHSILEAECEAEADAVRRVKLAGKDDVRHLQWWLSRKCPERWGQDAKLLKELLKEVAELRKDVARSGANPALPEESPSNDPNHDGSANA